MLYFMNKNPSRLCLDTEKRIISGLQTSAHITTQNRACSKLNKYVNCGRRADSISQGMASIQEKETAEYAEKKGERTDYHTHKKKLKMVLRERKHAHASRFACGPRAWKKIAH